MARSPGEPPAPGVESPTAKDNVLCFWGDRGAVLAVMATGAMVPCLDGEPVGRKVGRRFELRCPNALPPGAAAATSAFISRPTASGPHGHVKWYSKHRGTSGFITQ